MYTFLIVTFLALSQGFLFLYFLCLIQLCTSLMMHVCPLVLIGTTVRNMSQWKLLLHKLLYFVLQVIVSHIEVNKINPSNSGHKSWDLYNFSKHIIVLQYYLYLKANTENKTEGQWKHFCL